ncbi:MAG: ATP-dependent DNA helicase RecG [Candidatus Omnitrophota bacterium]|nr:MAG: ATP-dependent DNA helicase RecG [Candidatus Omnitrophota bacterium]
MQSTPIRYLKGVGPKKEKSLNRLGIHTIRDLLYYFPFRYQDRRHPRRISELEVNEPALIKGKIMTRRFTKIPYFIRSRKIKSIFEVILEDGSGKIRCVWFNQGYLADVIGVGQEIILYGKLAHSKGKFQFVVQEYELIEEKDSLNLDRIVGIYSLTASLSQKFMRKIIYSALADCKKNISDHLPFYIRKEKAIPNIARSLEGIHFPNDWQEAEQARGRFIFEELFYSQILVYLRKSQHRSQKGVAFPSKSHTLRKIRENLAFRLTSSQEEALAKILSDLEKSYPMHRLLQGDVGCGKTAVSAFAIGVCVDCGWQAALMVPTEVLAYQHCQTLKEVFRGFNWNIEVLVSSLPEKRMQKIYREMRNGKVHIVVGTHALIQEQIEFQKLGLVIIDEQHKFGVGQRALLPKKGKTAPHCLVMSATPIPRSLALSLYGDLDLSVIKELPPGRIAPHTMWLREERRQWVYDFLRERLQEGRQVYIIYPVIEESQEEDLQSLEQMCEVLTEEFVPFRVGTFHGRMRAKEKLDVVKAFREKKIDILVATTVVEVGVNIENATAMVVENPERFGLAQLHQLRGRIQRSLYQPHYILISKENLSQKALERLRIISQVSDGFNIAEEDLKMRGPGDFFGFSQHGFPQLRIADPLRDLEMLKQARLFAYRVIKSDPDIARPAHRCIKDHLDFWFQR